MIKSIVPPSLSSANRTGWKQFLLTSVIYPTVTVVAITGCGAPRQLAVTPGNRLTAKPTAPTHQATAPSFTVGVQSQPTVKQGTAPICNGCSGLRYDQAIQFNVEITSTGFIGLVQLSVANAPPGLLVAPTWNMPPVNLNVGNSASVQVVPVTLFVEPGATIGSYPLTLVATPLAGSNSSVSVNSPLTLTVSSPFLAQ